MSKTLKLLMGKGSERSQKMFKIRPIDEPRLNMEVWMHG